MTNTSNDIVNSNSFATLMIHEEPIRQTKKWSFDEDHILDAHAEPPWEVRSGFNGNDLTR